MSEEVRFCFDRFAELSERPLRIAVIGHTDHGKTSTVRTFCEDAKFGEVRDESGTTREIKHRRVQYEGKTTHVVTDTPGFEDIDNVLEEMKATAKWGDESTLKDVCDFLESGDCSELSDDDCQELSDTLEEIGKHDVLLFVLDVRTAVTEPFKTELKLLQRSSGIPMIVTFNFCAKVSAKVDQWSKYLKSIGQFTFANFDAHERTWEHDNTLYETIKLLLQEDFKKAFIDHWLQFRKDRREAAMEQSAWVIARALGKIKDLTKEVPRATSNDGHEFRQAESEIREQLVKEKNCCIQSIATSFGYGWNDINNRSDAVVFKPVMEDAISIAPSEASIGLAAGGATSGVAIDLAFGGLTLGAGAVVGAVTGAALGYFVPSAYRYSQYQVLRLADDVIWQVADALVGFARVLRNHSRADPNLIPVDLNTGTFSPSTALAERWKAERTSPPLLKRLEDEVKLAIEKRSA